MVFTLSSLLIFRRKNNLVVGDEGPLAAHLSSSATPRVLVKLTHHIVI